MRISIILAHPSPSSFNHAIARRACETAAAAGHEVVFHDLYREGFDPLIAAEELGRNALLDDMIARHCEEIARADGIVVVHPNWWGMPPAILKGWIDRVIRPGIAYEFVGSDIGEGIPNGLLRARTALVFNTGDTEAGRERDVFGDPLETIWRNCIFGFCGVADVRRQLFGVLITSNAEQRARWLDDVAATVRDAFPAATVAEQPSNQKVTAN